ncbi:MAG: isoamylase [Nocardioidaceae bacterium]|nr:isoamylase [Nocardioidaceae bacterium]
MTPGLWRSLGDRAPVWPGRNWPLGATWTPESTNFAVYAPDATEVWLCVFDDQDESGGERRFPLTEHSLGIWHGELPGLAPGTRYGYRINGPWDPDNGMRFNPQQLLLDPYGLAVSGTIAAGPEILPYDVDDPSQPSQLDSAPATARSVVVDPSFDWEDDRPIQRRWRDTVIYEVHVKGFTKLHDRIPEEIRGTYAGLGHPVVTDYLRDLGVTAVELLPVHQFFSEPALLERGLTNYWGYNSIGFFSPDASYSSSGDRGQQVTEFKQMVKSFHEAGIEVILDVVYNHTAEADARGASLSFRGLDDRGFYRRVPPAGDDNGDGDGEQTAPDGFDDT